MTESRIEIVIKGYWIRMLSGYYLALNIDNNQYNIDNIMKFEPQMKLRRRK